MRSFFIYTRLLKDTSIVSFQQVFIEVQNTCPSVATFAYFKDIFKDVKSFHKMAMLLLLPKGFVTKFGVKGG